MMTRRPISLSLVAAAASALVLVTSAGVDAAARRSTLTVKVTVIERCSAKSSGGKAQLSGCPKAAILRTQSAPAAVGAGPALRPIGREVAIDEQVRYLTVIY